MASVAPHRAPTNQSGSIGRRAGRVRLGWLAPALLRPRLTELERDDLVQTLVAQHRAENRPVTDEAIQDTARRQVGLALGAADLEQIRSELHATGCRLAD